MLTQESYLEMVAVETGVRNEGWTLWNGNRPKAEKEAWIEGTTREGRDRP